MSAISPFKTFQHFGELQTTPVLGPPPYWEKDTLSNILLVSLLESKSFLMHAILDLSIFVALIESLLNNLYKELCNKFKDAPFEKMESCKDLISSNSFV